MVNLSKVVSSELAALISQLEYLWARALEFVDSNVWNHVSRRTQKNFSLSPTQKAHRSCCRQLYLFPYTQISKLPSNLKQIFYESFVATSE